MPEPECIYAENLGQKVSSKTHLATTWNILMICLAINFPAPKNQFSIRKEESLPENKKKKRVNSDPFSWWSTLTGGKLAPS